MENYQSIIELIKSKGGLTPQEIVSNGLSHSLLDELCAKNLIQKDNNGIYRPI
ncbi:MAG: hypothetical protein J7K26_01500 [Candidatus Aenigmarchaeota archaeon]|nr:hypothetical protein [Candidatus Aenigmarchaeota archaeon]